MSNHSCLSPFFKKKLRFEILFVAVLFLACIGQLDKDTGKE